jgi:hypothetical protein
MAGTVETVGLTLEDAVLRLRKIHAWQHLEAPEAPAYRLALRNSASGELAMEGTLLGGEKYGFVLKAETATPSTGRGHRYAYVFVIDSTGRSVLLFPASGSVENRVSPGDLGAPSSPVASPFPLGPAAVFEVTAPYGRDTYFLLTSDEAIPNPWVLEWDGVRTRGPQGSTPLEELLSVTGGAVRAAVPLRTPATWTLERLVFESVPAGAKP